MYHGALSWLNTLLSFIKSLPGRIVSALGDLGNLLLNAGKAIIDGLINGIKGALGTLGHVVGSIGSFIANLKGPLPKDLTLLVPHGKAIMTGLVSGIQSGLPGLAAAMGTVTSAIGTGMPGAAGPVMVPALGSAAHAGAGQRTASLGGSASMADVVARLDKLIATTAAVPAGVGAHVGGAIGGAASAASFRSRYPRGGS